VPSLLRGGRCILVARMLRISALRGSSGAGRSTQTLQPVTSWASWTVLPADVGPSGLASRCSAAARGSTGFTSSSGSGVSTRALLLACGVLPPDDECVVEAAMAARTRPLGTSEAHERAGRGTETCWLLLLCLPPALCGRVGAASRGGVRANGAEQMGLLSLCRASWEQGQRQVVRNCEDHVDPMSTQSRHTGCY